VIREKRDLDKIAQNFIPNFIYEEDDMSKKNY
jgi:hypothetical protein